MYTMLTGCYQGAPSVLAQIQRQQPIKKDGKISKITNYLGIRRRLGPPTSCQKEKTLVNEQVKLESRTASTVVVQILFALRT